MEKIKLFCFPYAGGSSMVYSKFKNYLSDYIELKAIEPAGRGRRFSQAFYNSFEEEIEDIYSIVSKEVGSGEYAFFGYSMGSCIAYALDDKMEKMGHKGPRHIFFSANEPAHLSKNNKLIHLLPDDEFMKEIMELGGTPKEVFENKELLSIFLPVLRADYKVYELYRTNPIQRKLKCGASVLVGKEDKEAYSSVRRWSEIAPKGFFCYEFEGGHFFINDNVESICKIINNTLTPG